MKLKKMSVATILSVLISSPLLAAGVGNVQVNLGQDNMVWACGPWEISIQFTNDAPLYAFAIGLELSTISTAYHFVRPYGTLPAANPAVEVSFNPTNAFDLGIGVDVSQLPDRIFISGGALSRPLPPSTEAPSMVMKIRVYFELPGQWDDEIFVDNIIHPLQHKWLFRDEAEYAPFYNGIANNSMTDPSAPPICADLVVAPCGGPIFTFKPPSSVSIPFCDTYSFDFDGIHPLGCGEVFFDAVIGSIDSITGYYSLLPDGGAGPIVDTVKLYSDFYCHAVPYVFTINRTNAAPEVNNCRPILYVQQGTAKMVEYNVNDADTCDGHNWGLSLLSGTPPTFPVSINSGPGVLIVDATTAVTEETFDYQIVSIDLHGGEGSCVIQLQTISGVAGDADNSSTITVSDAVYLINYIFSGGPQPISMYRADPDCSGATTVSDVVYLINYIFGGGLAPCGVEP